MGVKTVSDKSFRNLKNRFHEIVQGYGRRKVKIGCFTSIEIVLLWAFMEAQCNKFQIWVLLTYAII